MHKVRSEAMITEKLYDRDSHISSFRATVIACCSSEKGYELILDKTAFFPEGGGQSADTGKVGEANITDVQVVNDEIVHYSDKRLDVGDELDCEIDWEQRFRRMQNHSGEHIVSGIVHKLYGYENVGFHLGEDVTVDFNGEHTREQLLEIEKQANEAIYKNAKFTCEYPDESTLKTLSYRSKLELTENVRIVTIEGYDVCACCAPHVYSAGEIGIIKILDFARHRGGIRLHMLCGKDALEDYEKKYDNLRSVATALCSKQNEAADAFEKFNEEHGVLKAELAALKKELAQLKASTIESTDECILIFESNADINDLRKLVLNGAEKTTKLCAGFSGSDKSGYRFVIASKHIDLREKSKDITAALCGRGGGSAELLQGNATASENEARKYFKENF